MDKKEIEDFIKKLSEQELNEINKKELENAKKQFDQFKNKFSKGECYICNSKLISFDKNKPCVHWLLRPGGFKKKYFDSVFSRFDYSNIDSYLRWVANQEVLFQNINDLQEEKKESMVFEYTIKYQNFEWSFSCSNNDFQGHKGSSHCNYPHYHFQMRIDNKPFIDFGDFHIPLTEHDKFTIKVKRKEIENITHHDLFGAGMDSLFQHLKPEEILKHVKTTKDIDKATIHTSYFIQADPGKTISENDLADLIKESRETGTPLWNLLPKLKNAKGKAIISPGEGVPNIFQRKGRGKKNKEFLMF